MQEVARRWGFYREMENHQELSFTPLPDDIIVAVPQKCGTTWLLHICHQIRMRGAEPDFKSQADVITWIELAQGVYKVDPVTMPQPASPRILYSHSFAVSSCSQGRQDHLQLQGAEGCSRISLLLPQFNVFAKGKGFVVQFGAVGHATGGEKSKRPSVMVGASTR